MPIVSVVMRVAAGDERSRYLFTSIGDMLLKQIILKH